LSFGSALFLCLFFAPLAPPLDTSDRVLRATFEFYLPADTLPCVLEMDKVARSVFEVFERCHSPFVACVVRTQAISAMRIAH
jgi:hypothetical protein